MYPKNEHARRLIAALRPKNPHHCIVRVEGDVDDAMAARIVADLAAAPRANTLTVFVNSPGGDLRAGQRIHKAIRNHPARRKLAYGFGNVASAAALVFTAADVRRLYPDTVVLLHAVALEPTSGERWTQAAYAAHAATLAALDESVAVTMAERLGVPVGRVLARMADERPTPLIEALSIGFAHEVVGQSPPLQKAWPAHARAAFAKADRFTHGANGRCYSPGFLAACAIGGK
jgi:ATP-dependent protease ClpP protease subunit